MFEGETDHRNLSYVSPQILCDDFSTNLTILGQVKCRDGFEESMFEANATLLAFKSKAMGLLRGQLRPRVFASFKAKAMLWSAIASYADERCNKKAELSQM